MPIVRGEWAMLLAPGLNMRTFQQYQERPEEYRRIVNVQNSTRAYEENNSITGLGPLAPKAELEPVIFDEPLALGQVRYIHQTFGLAVGYSKEMRDDDQYGVMGQLAGLLGRSARYTAEVYGHDVYNNAFTTAKYRGRDGQPLLSTAHPVAATGGIAANKPAVDVDLSQAALEAALTNFETQVDERGMPIMIQPRMLLITPSQVFTAARLLQSAQMPGTANNDVNPLANSGLQVVVSHFLTDDDAWFILGAPNEIDVNFYWREMPDTKTWDDDTADATFHKIRQRHSVGFGDWRGVYGSAGA